MGINREFVVLKFGGTSVSSVERWGAIASAILRNQKNGKSVVIVCSAISGISNDLESLVSRSLNGDDYEEKLDQIKRKHLDLCRELNLDNGIKIIEQQLDRLHKIVLGIHLLGQKTTKIHAEVMACGELMLTKIAQNWLLSIGITCKWLDARHYLKAVSESWEQDSSLYLDACCHYQKDENLINDLNESGPNVFLTQGFIAANDYKETVLLGRGGSDTSAAYFAAKIAAERLEIWTDVPGIFSSNPHEVPSSQLILKLGYEEAQELAASGAKVLHPRCIAPLRELNIPIDIKWTEHPDFFGSTISSDSGLKEASIKAVLVRKRIQMISMEALGMWQESGFLARIFECFGHYRISVDLVATSQSNVTVTLDRQSNPVSSKAFDGLLNKLAKFCKVKLVEDCAALSIVGKNIRSLASRIGAALEVLEGKQVFLISQAASDLNFTLTVPAFEADSLVRKLHAMFFSEGENSHIFGGTWEEITKGGSNVEKAKLKPAWWESCRPQILELSRSHCPAYVYNESGIRRALENLRSISEISRINYAVKANSNPRILNIVKEVGACFDCVSKSEIEHVLKHVKGAKGPDIIFTPNFASIDEYSYALKQECVVTLDNLFPLEQHSHLFRNKEIFLRMDPEVGKGHHKHVRTAGKQSKFGISSEELSKAIELVSRAKAKVVGLHAHVGSGIQSPETWAETAVYLSSLSSSFPDLRVLNLGGGLGVPEKPGQKELDLQAVSKHLARFKLLCSEFELWLEPGRYLVSTSGVLIASVTQLKVKGEKHYVGLNTGMNALLRPALYGSFHNIVNLSRLHHAPFMKADIVGPICETGDVLGYRRELPQTFENDVFLIENSGAYGREMASSYNKRTPPPELFIN